VPATALKNTIYRDVWPRNAQQAVVAGGVAKGAQFVVTGCVTRSKRYARPPFA
jgi:hypothetical protein